MSYGLKPKPRIEGLALTRETILDLTGTQAEMAKGGRTAYCSTRPACGEEIPQLEPLSAVVGCPDRATRGSRV
jgi:hypothetical protein